MCKQQGSGAIPGGRTHRDVIGPRGLHRHCEDVLDPGLERDLQCHSVTKQCEGCAEQAGPSTAHNMSVHTALGATHERLGQKVEEKVFCGE